MRTCFKCTSENICIYLKGNRNVIECQDCGADNGTWGEPMTLERALKFTMPIGQYKGVGLLEIARLDMGYLTWARSNMENKNVVDAIKLVTQHWVTKTKGEN